MCSCLELHPSDCAVRIILLVLKCNNVENIHKVRAQSQEQFRPNALFKVIIKNKSRKDIEITTQTMNLQIYVVYGYVDRLSVHHFASQTPYKFTKNINYEYKIQQ